MISVEIEAQHGALLVFSRLRVISILAYSCKSTNTHSNQMLQLKYRPAFWYPYS